MAFVSLQTDRLIIRDHVHEDLYTHHCLISNPIVMYYLQDIQTHSFEESEENLLQAIKEIEKENRTKFFFRIEEKYSLAHIGEIGYTVNQETPFGKIVGLGYFINKEYWSKGYVTEAVKEVLRYAFEENNVIRVSTGCIKENQGSEKVMQKCNMVKEADFRMHSWHNGMLKDRVEYRMLKDEWYSNIAKRT